ncbi:hypothetical protein AYO20_00800 [Fonsecaea nubica]|uniref:Metallo-beta-lactamase domain-containing protein n=1 Tax=Fonsecaea nubica TaxID=856822 RepID=A0A178DD39_9EURO|nr:hypothetical protein AYO20_00800 [Fonsecaea nubica]OAL39888.1 hypothetical protein AYO20_00800 [Fonsecaea nubica]
MACKEMSKETSADFHVPVSCPFTIDEIEINGLTNSTTYLIREHDRYGEFPHIYAKICGTPSSGTPHIHPNLRHRKVCWAPSVAVQNELEGYKVIVLSDTGCGTEVPNSRPQPSPPTQLHDEQRQCKIRTEPAVWNIRTFLEYTINPGGRIPYLVMTTHCHYDHIMGIGRLPPTSTATDYENSKDHVSDVCLSDESARPRTTVLSSSYGKSFITPYSNLQDHSLCDKLGLQAPRYDVGIWAADLSHVIFTHPTISSSSPAKVSPRPLPVSITTPLTILHTPGHTPDSLSWYDSDLRLLCVGDSFYVKETAVTQDAKWGPEPPMPVIFDLESDLGQWWWSLKKVLGFVRVRNAETEKREVRENEGLQAEAKDYDEVGTDADDDEEFVYIDADELAPTASKNSVEVAAKERARPTLPSHSVEESKEHANVKTVPKRIVTGKQETRTKQTGFDIPSPSKRGVIALPILSAPEGRLPADTDQADDVWMMVVDPVARPRPQRQLDHPPRFGLNPVITSHRVQPGLPDPRLKREGIRPRPRDLSIPQVQTQPQGFATRRPRVRLCAAHTTLSVDAERAILSIQRFMTRILENDVPCRRAEDGPRGEERWIWDDALSSPISSATQTDTDVMAMKERRDTSVHAERAEPEQGHRRGTRMAVSATPARSKSKHSYSYSVVAPLSVINEGRRNILGRHRHRHPAGVV